jgi:UDP-N-acetylmuramate dehydrogenase
MEAVAMERETVAVLPIMPAWSSIFNEAMATFWGGEVLWQQSMSQYTTYKVGGPAQAMVFPCGIKELANLLEGVRRLDIPWRVIGGGSNILVSDEGLEGITIVLNKGYAAKTIVQDNHDSVLVKVETGCSLAGFVNWCIDHSLTGMEFAVGIPGSVGGALVMNAGAFGGEISRVLSIVTLMNEQGDVIEKQASDMNYSYRHWGEEEGQIALEGLFLLRRGDKQAIRNSCLKLLEKRRGHQPIGPSCGSFFKNPDGFEAAGALIEKTGLKGVKVGGAAVSMKHANFLLNTGGATAQDLVSLMQLVQSEVKGEFGVFLEPEVKLLGF